MSGAAAYALEQRKSVVTPERLAREQKERYAEHVVRGRLLLTAFVCLTAFPGEIFEIMLVGQAKIRLRTILTALGMGKGSRKISNADLDEIERVAETFMADLKRVEAEPDIAKRREMIREVGPNFGRLNALWTRINETMPPNEQALCEHYQEMIMGRLLGEVLALCN
jgi:hypothetical protein